MITLSEILLLGLVPLTTYRAVKRLVCKLRDPFSSPLGVLIALLIIGSAMVLISTPSFAKAARDIPSNPDSSGSVPNNLDTELVSLYKAAKQGNPAAQRLLAERFVQANGVATSPRKAYFWYRKAAEQGDAVAQLNVGLMLGLGTGVKPNKYEGVIWVRRSAEQGFPTAQAIFGIFLLIGETVQKNHKAAVFWLRQAAKSGNTEAMHILRKMEEGLERRQIRKFRRSVKRGV